MYLYVFCYVFSPRQVNCFSNSSASSFMISDRNKFVKIDFNPKHKVNQDIRHLLDMEFEMKSCLDDLYNHNYLSKDDYKFLKPCGSKPGVMYGLCKVHKGTTDNDNVPPFRPTLSAIGSCNYNLAKYFVIFCIIANLLMTFFLCLSTKIM